MKSYKIACSNCRHAFIIKITNPEALRGKSFQCPKCGVRFPFDRLLQKMSADALHTHIGGGNTDDLTPPNGHTRVAQQTNARAILTVDGSVSEFKLSPGTYILGRDSSDSRATLRIAPDQFMSRAHATLKVEAAGNRLQASITPMKSANAIFINNDRLEYGRSCMLKDGDRILLGMTTVRIKI